MDWLKIATSVIFFSTLLTCAGVGIRTLLQSSNASSGIGTLIFDFNLTDIHLSSPLVEPRNIPARNLIQPFESDIQSVESFIPAATSKIQSAIGAAETAVIDLLPRNCSLGTKQFCVGFSNSKDCTDLPLNISKILPEAISDLVKNGLQSLLPLEGIMAKVTLANIEGSLILGLAMLLVMGAIFAYFLFKFISVGLPVFNKPIQPQQPNSGYGRTTGHVVHKCILRVCCILVDNEGRRRFEAEAEFIWNSAWPITR